MDTHYSKATVISLQFEYSCIIMYKSSKDVNKYTQLIILTFYGCDMTVPYTANSH